MQQNLLILKINEFSFSKNIAIVTLIVNLRKGDLMGMNDFTESMPSFYALKFNHNVEIFQNILIYIYNDICMFFLLRN